MEEMTMKKIFLALAAVAALASCVKENAPVLDQDNDNLVTITALATKTTLDGTSVVWDADDEIGVVYDITLAEIPVFSTTGSGSSVKFTGAHPDGYMETTSAYAVYPSSAVTLEGGLVKISHNLPEVQTGVVTPGMILSSALLDAEDLKAGNATAQFHNALALVKVIVPADVQSVSLTSSNETLTGAAEFYAPSPSLGRKSSQSGSKTVTLSKGGLEPLPSENDLLVYPANASTLNVRIVGMDGTEYEKNVPTIVFEASKYRTLDLTNLFYMDVEADSEVPVSSMGGTFEVNVVAVDDNTYNVTIESGNPWIQHVQTKAFNGKTIEFNVEPNTSTSSREADITITWDGGSRNFTVVQEGKAELSFVYVDPEDPESGLIQWQETFDIYNSYFYAQNKLNPVKTYNNVFTISLSEGEEMAHGTYKIENIFYANRQTQGTKGGTYFANYSDGVLTIKTNEDDGAIRSYYFNNDIELTYDKEAKTFALAAPVQYKKDSFNGDLQEGYIGNYSVAIKVSDPGAGGASAIDNLVGNTWAQSCTDSYMMPMFSQKVAITKIDATHVSISNLFEYATISSAVFDPSAMTLTVPAGWTHMYVGSSPLQEVVFNVSNDYKTLTCTASPLVLSYMSVTGYKLTKE